MAIRITYDTEADALYIELRPAAPGLATCRDLAEDIVADYDPDGKLAGIEILDATYYWVTSCSISASR